ncbi:MAG TPA: HEAT repeat domain-containing protein [Thermomicrobiaceae bacterium]|nr:HEAT repeat domain-containing protein [Thermomicrobiaceae bacterium]
MSSTTNRFKSNHESDDRIAKLIAEYTGGAKAGPIAVKLSDLSRSDARALASAWSRLSTTQRRGLVRSMTDQAEANVELNFTRALQVAALDPDPEVRALAVGGLWEDESWATAEILLGLFGSEREEAVREAIVIALGRYAYLSAMDELDDERSALVRRVLLEASRPEEALSVQRRAIESVAYLADDPEVTRLISDAYAAPERELRVSALFAMSRNLDRCWLSTALQELGSDDPEFRFEAAKACGEFGDERAVAPLLDLVDDEDREVQLAAIGAIGQIGGKTATNVLRRLRQSEDEVLRDAADDALVHASYATDPLRPIL